MVNEYEIYWDLYDTKKPRIITENVQSVHQSIPCWTSGNQRIRSKVLILSN